MRCKGKVKVKGPDGKKRNKLCNQKLAENAIFCPVCGEPTGALKNELSARKNWQQSWQKVKSNLGKYLPFSIFFIFTALLVNVAALYVTWGNYWLVNLAMLFTVPFLLVPLAINHYDFTISNYLKELRFYPQYWLFVLVSIVYFFLLKVICTGFLLNVAIDAILHIVRLVMVLYWIAIVLPAPVLIAAKRVNAVKAIRMSYVASAETRWQQFFLEILALLGIIIGAALAGLGLLVAIPLMYYAFISYYHALNELKLFEQNKTEEDN